MELEAQGASYNNNNETTYHLNNLVSLNIQYPLNNSQLIEKLNNLSAKVVTPHYMHSCYML